MPLSTALRTLLSLTALSLLGATALAQDKYPSKPVTVVVPQAAGGANDAIARIVAQKLTELSGQSFVVENRPGAGGNIGTAYVAKAKPDGYTLMLTADSSYVINPSLYKSTGFDPLKDFEAVTPVATAGYVLVANNNFPANTTAELIAQAKAQPGKIMIGSAGNGTVNHLVGEMLNKAAGIELVHVPYKGAAAAVTDLASGQVQVSVQSLPSSIGVAGCQAQHQPAEAGQAKTAGCRVLREASSLRCSGSPPSSFVEARFYLAPGAILARHGRYERCAAFLFADP